MEFAQDVAYMRTHSALTDHQLVGNILIRQAARNEDKNLSLSVGQRLVRGWERGRAVKLTNQFAGDGCLLSSVCFRLC